MIHIPFIDVQAGYRECRHEIDSAYARVMASGRWILGAELEQFEAEFAAYCGTRHCVGVGNGLDAIYLALRALDIGPGDEVIVPAHTFVATWLAIVRAGATPVPVEPDAKTFMPTAGMIEDVMSVRTRAVIAVHLYGSVAGIEDVVALCRRRDILLVEDAAQAHGAQSTLARAGNHGVAGCFSFYPTKNLGACGDGGAVVTNDSALRDRLRALRNYGSRERYVHDEAGINSRLDELQAAMLRVRLRRLDVENARRAEVAARYCERLTAIAELQLPVAGVLRSHVWHLFVVQTDARNELQRHLAANGCETLIHYPKPVYRWPPFHEYAPAGVSVADRLTQRVLSLPMGPQLSDDDIGFVSDAVAGFFRQGS